MTLKEFRESQEKGFNATSLMYQNKNTGNVYVLIDRTEPELRIEVKRYSFDGERWTVGFIYVGNDYVCAMDSFQRCLSDYAVDPLEGMQFKCPSCGHTRLETCQSGYHLSPITCIDESGDFDYGEIQSHGYVDRFQCEGCGFILKKHNIDISDNEEVVKWIQENCNGDTINE